MTSRRFKVVLEWDPEDSVWVTYVPALNHLSTHGQTRDEALEQTREAILGYLEAAAAASIPVPELDAEIEVTEVEVVST
jgi:antitoxin HicB